MLLWLFLESKAHVAQLCVAMQWWHNSHYKLGVDDCWCFLLLLYNDNYFLQIASPMLSNK